MYPPSVASIKVLVSAERSWDHTGQRCLCGQWVITKMSDDETQSWSLSWISLYSLLLSRQQRNGLWGLLLAWLEVLFPSMSRWSSLGEKGKYIILYTWRIIISVGVVSCSHNIWFRLISRFIRKRTIYGKSTWKSTMCSYTKLRCVFSINITNINIYIYINLYIYIFIYH